MVVKAIKKAMRKLISSCKLFFSRTRLYNNDTERTHSSALTNEKILSDRKGLKLSAILVIAIAVVVGAYFVSLPTVQEIYESAKQLGKQSAETVSKTIQPMSTYNTNEGQYSTDDLNGLIYDLSSWWNEEGNVNMLKVLIREFKIPVRQIQKNDDPYNLLNLLIGPGVIKSSDVNVLIEAAYVCDLLGVESKIKDRIPSFPGFENFDIKKISKHRQNLIEFGNILTDESTNNIAKLEHIKSYSDQWDLIFQLETNSVLTEEGKDEFAMKLEKQRMKKEANALNKYQ